MDEEPPFLRLLREWLGATSSSPEEVERILTEATFDWIAEDHMRELGTTDEQLAFVDGPLTSAVSRTMPPERAIKAIRKIGSAVAMASINDRVTPVYSVPDRITGQLPVPPTEIVPVLVIAESDATANRLAVLLGDERARVERAHDKLTVVAGLAEHPLVVVIDATDPTTLTADQLVSLVDRGLPHTFWVVWGASRSLARALESRVRRFTHPSVVLDDADGLGPIRDIVLSRRPL